MYTDPSGEFWHIVVGAVVGGVINLAANWNNSQGFWEHLAAFGVGAVGGAVTASVGGASFWAVTGTAAASGALTMGTNSIISQTGANFSGFNNVDWNIVGRDAVVGGFSSFAGSSAGIWATNSSMLVNGFSSPVLRSLAVSPITSGAGHIVGGTTFNLLEGQSLDTAFGNSFKGIGKSMAVGTGFGFTTTVVSSYANGISPWTGKSYLKNTFTYDFTIDDDIYEQSITLYRGTTGSENDSGFLFMTDNPEYASSYIKNGGSLVKVTLPRYTLYKMQYNFDVTLYKGIYNTNTPFIEYRFSSKVKPLIVNQFKR